MIKGGGGWKWGNYFLIQYLARPWSGKLCSGEYAGSSEEDEDDSEVELGQCIFFTYLVFNLNFNNIL